jgi:hypothetical protein
MLSKENKHTDIRIWTHIRIRIQLSQPNFSKDPKKKKNYNINPGSFMKLPKSTTLSPDIAAEEEDDHRRALETPLRQLALSGRNRHPSTNTGWSQRRNRNDQGCAPTSPAPRSELADGDRRHRGKTEPDPTNLRPQHPTVALHPSKRKGRPTNSPSLDLQKKEMRRIPFSPASPMALEGDAKGARKRYGEFILPRRQR